MAFRGEHYHAVDDKGRVIIPLKFRSELGATFVITKGVGGCLFIYREKDFQVIEEKLQAQPVLDQHALLMKRWLFAGASDIQVDSQGRIAIPASLRLHAGISENSDAVIAGTGEKIEVWSRDSWMQMNASMDESKLIEAAQRTGLGADF
ncbi:MAG: division/cell wall cluster transcriptional repressor MraZ [Armatimonadota bacterium]